MSTRNLARDQLLNRLLKRAIPGFGGCVIYTGAIDQGGYGRIDAGGKGGGKKLYAHRAAYELMVGPISEGMVVDHACHNRDANCLGGESCLHRRCINPHHLEAVTAKENSLRSALSTGGANSRKAHCPKSHEYTGENTYRDSLGRRYCRQCQNDRRRARRAAERGERR